MEDRYAESTVDVDIWVEGDWVLEDEVGRHVGVVGWEGEVAAEIASAIVFAVIRDHEHNLPLEDVFAHQTARYSWQVLRRLHVLELS